MLDGTQAHGLRGRTGRRLATTYHRSAGLQLVPETRHIFGSWSVEENLVLAGLSAKSGRPLSTRAVWKAPPRSTRLRRPGGCQSCASWWIAAPISALPGEAASRRLPPAAYMGSEADRGAPDREGRRPERSWTRPRRPRSSMPPAAASPTSSPSCSIMASTSTRAMATI